MMRPGAQVKVVHLCQAPVDFRKSINGLSLLVEQHLALDPFAPDSLYVFVNRPCNKIKILYWERNWIFRAMGSQHSGPWEATVPDHEKPRFRRM